SALGRDRDARWFAAPRRERAGDETLVVAALALVPAVGIGCIEERHAGIEGGVQDGDGVLVIPIEFGRQAHAPQRDGTRPHRWRSRSFLASITTGRSAPASFHWFSRAWWAP